MNRLCISALLCLLLTAPGITEVHAQDKIKAAGVKLIAADALSAAEKAGSARAVNVVLMGVLSRVLPGIELSSWKAAVEKCVPAKVIEINEKAFDLGREL